MLNLSLCFLRVFCFFLLLLLLCFCCRLWQFGGFLLVQAQFLCFFKVNTHNLAVTLLHLLVLSVNCQKFLNQRQAFIFHLFSENAADPASDLSSLHRKGTITVDQLFNLLNLKLFSHFLQLSQVLVIVHGLKFAEQNERYYMRLTERAVYLYLLAEYSAIRLWQRQASPETYYSISLTVAFRPDSYWTVSNSKRYCISGKFFDPIAFSKPITYTISQMENSLPLLFLVNFSFISIMNFYVQSLSDLFLGVVQGKSSLYSYYLPSISSFYAYCWWLSKLKQSWLPFQSCPSRASISFFMLSSQP